MKNQMLKLALGVLAMLPIASVSVAAQSKLTLIEDTSRTSQLLTNSATSSEALLVQKLNKKGLINRNLNSVRPPEPSVF